MTEKSGFRAAEFVAALESDEELRALYDEDPRAALERFGLSITDEDATAIRVANAAGTAAAEATMGAKGRFGFIEIPISVRWD